MALLKDPVTSSVCHHSYSKEAILDYITQARNRGESAKCPRSGCTKVISPSTLKDDRDLAKRVATHKRRMELAEGNKRTQAAEIID